MLPKHLRWSSESQPPVGEVSVRGLTPEQVRAVFQPIVDTRTGGVVAQEVLARCSLPEFASPLVLFEQAVREQACGRLGRLVREAAVADCQDFPLFLNIHPDELSTRWLVRPDDPLALHEHQVYLEITETAAFTHYALCRSVLRELCDRTSARLVIDDFGAGHSNLQRVLDLSPAVVKLDLSLIRGVDQDKRKQVIVRHVTAMCHDLGAQVVAEGIETQAELETAMSQGVDLVQGYFLARPQNPPPLANWPFASGVTPPGGLASRKSAAARLPLGIMRQPGSPGAKVPAPTITERAPEASLLARAPAKPAAGPPPPPSAKGGSSEET